MLVCFIKLKKIKCLRILFFQKFLKKFKKKHYFQVENKVKIFNNFFDILNEVKSYNFRLFTDFAHILIFI